jgi:hypothetical protein
MQQSLYFLPLAHGQRAFRETCRFGIRTQRYARAAQVLVQTSEPFLTNSVAFSFIPASAASDFESPGSARIFRHTLRDFDRPATDAKATASQENAAPHFGELLATISFDQTTAGKPTLRFSARSFSATRPNARSARATNAGVFFALFFFPFVFISPSASS